MDKVSNGGRSRLLPGRRSPTWAPINSRTTFLCLPLSLSLLKRGRRGQGDPSSFYRRQRGGTAIVGEGCVPAKGRRLEFGEEVAKIVEMAEICCDVGPGREAAAASTCKPTARAARRRRMELRRFRFVSGVPSPPAELGRKRQRIERCASAAISAVSELPLDLESSVTTESSEEGRNVEAQEYKRKSDSVGSPVPDTSPSASSSSSPSSSPSRAAESAATARGCPKYGMISVCGRRRDMEDAISIRPSFAEETAGYHFFGVFDGHGCSHVAMSCKDQMHEVVAEELRRDSSFSSRLAEPEWKAVMERSFSRMDASVSGWSAGSTRGINCRCEMQIPKCEHVGSTAVVAVVTPDRIVVSNCGDSRAVLCREGVPMALSYDHKPDRPDELQRIQTAGGRVIYWDGARVLGVLAMSRAIGDNYLKPFVISEPEVTVTARAEKDECLILASDGLWDVVSNETACQVVRMCLRGGAPGTRERAPPAPGPETAAGGGAAADSDKACSYAALLLTKLAHARNSPDNISVVVVDLRRKNS